MQYSEMEDGMLKIAFDTWERLAMEEVERINKIESMADADEDSLNAFGWYMANYNAIMDEFSKRNDNLKFSIEDIFLAVGQQDRSGIFRFYPGSDAYKQYGEQTQGTILYKKKERDELEQSIQQNPLPRTDGIIYLASHTYNDSLDNIEALKSNGFTAKDVMELLTFNFDNAAHAYNEKGTKEIPNTINLKINLDGIDPVIFFLKYIEQIREMGQPILKHDLLKYYCYLHIARPDLLSPDIYQNYLIDADTGDFSNEANFIILDGKSDRGDTLSDDEQKKFSELKSARFQERFRMVSKAMSAPAKLFSKIYKTNRALVLSIVSVISGFEVETISGPENNCPIYWDFDRFSHIMFRHYSGIRIAESPSFSNPDKQPTAFQYVFQDVQRLIKIIIRNLSKEIDSKLSQGKPFTVSGYYYNGNYYNLRIDPDGRLMQFHPLN
jgi:hypothetical protein